MSTTERASTAPEASIVVPSRGGRARLPVLFAALKKQTCGSFEVIVVCDGDIDDSAGVVASWGDRLPVRAIVFPENRGRSAALNAGFAAASGRVLIRCDDDLEPSPDFVANHVAHHSGEPVGIVGICPDIDPGTPYARVYGNDASDLTEAFWQTLGPAQAWRCWSANVSVTRATFDAIGEYDERYRKYGWEDVDWGYRLHLAGVPVTVVDDVNALHHGPERTTAGRAGKAFLSGASRATFIDKYGDDSQPAVSAGRGAWGLAVRLAALPMRGEGSVRWLGGVVDRIVPALPAPVAEKMIALVVESAGYRGASGFGGRSTTRRRAPRAFVRR